MRKRMVVAFTLGLVLLLTNHLSAQDSSIPFKALDTTDEILKFMRMRTDLQSPKLAKEKKSKIRFAMAEYYLKSDDYFDAKVALEEYLQDNLVDVSAILANVYLYKIAIRENNQPRIEAIKKEIFNKKFILLFDAYKMIPYSSLFGNEYEVHYYVDRIEILLNGNVFEIIRA